MNQASERPAAHGTLDVGTKLSANCPQTKEVLQPQYSAKLGLAKEALPLAPPVGRVPVLPPQGTIKAQKLTPGKQKAEDQAHASFITGILSLALLPLMTYGLPFGLAIASIILGKKARQNATAPEAARRARQGHIMGWFSLVLQLATAVLVALIILSLILLW